MSEASNIETRILEMKLDNDQFEKGVQATIKSLEDLEEKLELKDADSGFEKVASAANTLQFSNMERSLDVLTDKFSLLGNIGLQALTRISNKIVDMGEQLVKGIALDPLMDGWREFEMKTMSTQTIFGGIRNQFENTTEGRAQAFRQIGNELDRLNEYADQTIYNFAQMTENIGKFTNQGIGLGTATDAIKGIGNWAAMVGADTQQMSRAMYNISQSLGSGAMKLIDWKSIRFANMATPDVQKLFADIAMARGGLLDKKGRPYKQGSKQAAQAYNAILKDFEGSLKTGWLTNDIMMDAFRVLSNEMSEADWVALFGDTEKGQELIKTYKEMGEYAAEAATKVKTFSQLVGVLQESLGSGWATTWETLFGGFEKQTEFLTAISERIGKFIDKDSKERNKWVKNFTGMSILDEDGNFSGLKGLDVMTGTVLALVDAFLNLWDIVREVGKKLADPFGGRHEGFFFGDEQLQQVGLTAMNVAQIFSDLYYIFTTVNEWFKYAPDDRTLSPYESLISIFSGIGSVVGIAYETFMAFSRFAIRVGMLFMPIVTSILNLFGRLGDVLFSIYGNLAGQHIFDYFFNGLYDAVEPVISAFVELSTLIIDFIAEIFGLNDGMGELAGSGNKLGEPIQKLAGFIKNLFTPLTVVTKLFGGFTKGLTAGFRALRKHVKRDGVDQFTDLLDIVQEFVAAGFGEEAGKNARDWVEKNIVGTLKTMVEWMATSWTTISDFFTNLPDKFNDMITRFKAGFVAFRDYKYDDSLSGLENFKNRLHLLLNAIFGEETGNKLIDDYTKYIEPHIKTIAGAIETAFGEVNRVMKGIARVFQGEYGDLEDPFAVLQQIALNFLEGHDEGFTDPGVITRRLGVMNFFKQLKESYENNIQPYVDPVLKWFGEDLPNAFNTVQRALFGYDEVIENDSIYGGDRSTSPEMKHVGGVFENIWNWVNGEGTKIVDDIVGFFQNTWTRINTFLFGYDVPAGTTTSMWQGGHVLGVIDKIYSWVNGDGVSVVADIGKFFETAWADIQRVLFGPEIQGKQGNTYRSGGLIDQLNTLYDSITFWIDTNGKDIFSKISEFFTNGIETVQRILFGPEIIGKQGNSYRSGGLVDAFGSIFTNIDKWINEDGVLLVNEITTFFTTSLDDIQRVLFGPEIQGKQGNTYRSGGLIDQFNGVFSSVSKWVDEDGAIIVENIRTFFETSWADIQRVLFGPEVTGKQGNVYRSGGLIDQIKTLFSDTGERLSTYFQSAFEGISAWIEGDGKETFANVSEFFSKGFEDIQRALFGPEITGKQGNTYRSGGIVDTFRGAFEELIDWIGGDGQTMFDQIITFFEGVWAGIQRVLFGPEIIGKQGNTYRNGGLIGSLKTWIETDGNELWTKVDEFLHGKDTIGEDGKPSHTKGVFESVKAFLDPIWEWISQKGETVYEYLTTHDFDQMWSDLDVFLFGAKKIGKDGETIRTGSGILTPIINLLTPVYDFFDNTGRTIQTALSKVDFGEVWDKIQRFFLGYSETVESDSIYGGDRSIERHVDGLFDRIANMFERIVTFFESEDWQNIKASIQETYDQYIKPIFELLSGIGKTFFGGFSENGGWDVNKDFFGNLGNILSNTGTFAKTGFLSLLGNMLGGTPAGDFINNIFPGIFGDPAETTKAVEQVSQNVVDQASSAADIAQKASQEAQINFIDVIRSLNPLNLILPSGSYAEGAGDAVDAAGEVIDDATGNVTSKTGEFATNANALLDQWDENRKRIGEAISAVFSGIGDFFKGLLGSLGDIAEGNAGGIIATLGLGFGLSKVADITNALSGGHKDTVIQQLTSLIRAIGDFLTSITWFIGVFAAIDLVDDYTANNAVKTADGSEDKAKKTEQRIALVKEAFNTITRFIATMVGLFTGAAVVTTVVDGFLQVKFDELEDKHNTTMSADFSTISENLGAYASALHDMMEAISILIEDIWKIILTDMGLDLLYKLGLKSDDTQQKAEQTEDAAEQTTEKLSRMQQAIRMVTDVITSLVGSITWSSLIPSEVVNLLNAAGQGFLGAAIYNITGKGLRTRAESMSSVIMGMGSLLESVMRGVSTILNSVTLMSVLTNPEDVNKKIELVKNLFEVLPGVLNAVGGIVGKMGWLKFFNAASDLKFVGKGGTVLQTGGSEILSGFGAKFVQFVPTLLKALIIAAAVIEVGGWLMDRQIKRYASTLFMAAADISAIMNAFKKIDSGTVTNVGEAIGKVRELIQAMNTWGDGEIWNNSPVIASEKFRIAMSNVLFALDTARGGLVDHEDVGNELSIMLTELGEVWKLFSTFDNGNGFDVADFQGKMSYLQLVGQNFAGMAEAFRGVTAEDVGNMDNVNKYMEAYYEFAQIASTISALGDFNAFMMLSNPLGVEQFVVYLNELSEIGGSDRLKESFETLIEALPDDPALLKKLRSFTENGGGNIGSFTTGLTQLNYALQEYNRTMQTIGTREFTELADALVKIDNLGARLGANDFALVSNDSVQHANTRLGTFSNDLKTLAATLETLGNTAKTINSNQGSTLDDIATFFERFNDLGSLYDRDVINDGTVKLYESSSRIDSFTSSFIQLEQSFEAMYGILKPEAGQAYDGAALDSAAGFLERIAGIWVTLKGSKGFDLGGSLVDKILTLTTDLTSLGTALPILAEGVHSFYTTIQDDKLSDPEVIGKFDQAAGFLGRMASEIYAVINATSHKYSLDKFASELYNDNGTGLFQRLGQIFAASDELGFDSEGMKSAEGVITLIGGFAQQLANLLTAETGKTFTGTELLFEELSKSFADAVYPAISSMTIGELQAYAQAFGDLSDAMTLGGKTNMLAGAVSETIKAMQDQQVEIHVTPVIDWPDYMVPPELSANLNPDVTGGAVNNSYAQNMSMMVQFPEVQAVHLVGEDMSMLTGTIRSSNASTASAVVSAGEKIASLTVQLDTGVLVGQLVPQINRVLGRGFRGPGYIPVYNSEPETED